MLLMNSVDIDETPSCVEPVRQLGGVMLILLDTLCSILPTLLVVTNIVCGICCESKKAYSRGIC